MQYLQIDGRGDPNTSPAFADAVETLYPLAYKLKFASKRDLGRDYVVPPLEGLWWADDMDAFTTSRDRSEEHTSDIQSLMRLSYAVYCLKKKKTRHTPKN